MNDLLFPFKTGLQCVLESGKETDTLRKLLHLLYREGFSNVELNLPDLDIIRPYQLKAVIKDANLEMNMLATGAYAKKHLCSLSSSDEKQRKRAIKGCMDNIDYAAEMGCGVILGFFKGTAKDNCDASKYFLDSMHELKPYIEKKKTVVLIEATNHKETSVVKTLQEGAEILEHLNSPYIRLLADTYHMNIEESSLLDSLTDYMPYYPHLHISDNNRAYPGLGSLDFSAILSKLIKSGYCGTLAVEGNIQNSITEDVLLCASYLRKVKAFLNQQFSVCQGNHFDKNKKIV